MITFKQVDENPDSVDSRLLWEWRMDPVTRRMSGTTEEIPWGSHKAWYGKAAKDSAKVILIAMAFAQPAGMVRFDSLAADYAELSINLNPALRGQGKGKRILAAACAYGFGTLGLSRLHARIRPENIPSIKIFEGVGFVLQGEQDGFRAYNLEAVAGLVTEQP